MQTNKFTHPQTWQIADGRTLKLVFGGVSLSPCATWLDLWPSPVIFQKGRTFTTVTCVTRDAPLTCVKHSCELFALRKIVCTNTVLIYLTNSAKNIISKFNFYVTKWVLWYPFIFFLIYASKDLWLGDISNLVSFF